VSAAIDVREVLLASIRADRVSDLEAGAPLHDQPYADRRAALIADHAVDAAVARGATLDELEQIAERLSGQPLSPLEAELSAGGHDEDELLVDVFAEVFGVPANGWPGRLDATTVRASRRATVVSRLADYTLGRARLAFAMITSGLAALEGDDPVAIAAVPDREVRKLYLNMLH